MVLNGIEIDLIFASIVSLKTIPKNLSLNDNDLLIGMDDKSVRAITGPVCLPLLSFSHATVLTVVPACHRRDFGQHPT